jgi:alkylated DNA repair dioxygenase AlkB
MYQLYKKWLPDERAGQLYDALWKGTEWHQPDNKWGKTPRLIAYYGAKPYTYSGITHYPKAIPESLYNIKLQISEVAGCDFNSILLNYYRDGKDSIGWHSDDEHGLGSDAIVASLSLGETRLFKIRPQSCYKDIRKKIDFSLEHGDLLVMPAGFQDVYEHCIPKTAKRVNGRINVTLRKVIS